MEGATASMSSRVRNRFSGQPVSIQPRPTSVAPLAGGCDTIQAFSRAIASAADFEPSRLSVSSRSPMARRWAWLSVKPGNSAAPLRSMRRTRGPACAWAPLSPPTKTIRPSRTSTASAFGFAASPV